MNTHPLLVRAGITDFGLSLKFRDIGMVEPPGLTYQYSGLGRLAESDTNQLIPLCEDAPEIYREQFSRQWKTSNRDPEQCWSRLQGLVRELMQQYPEEPSVREEAWLVGLTAEIPPSYRERLDRMYKLIEEHQAKQVKWNEATQLAKQTGVRQPIEWWVTDRCPNATGEECGCYRATRYVLPDGSSEVDYICSY